MYETHVDSDPKRLQIGDCVNGLFAVVITARCDENSVDFGENSLTW